MNHLVYHFYQWLDQNRPDWIEFEIKVYYLSRSREILQGHAWVYSDGAKSGPQTEEINPFDHMPDLEKTLRPCLNPINNGLVLELAHNGKYKLKFLNVIGKYVTTENIAYAQNGIVIYC